MLLFASDAIARGIDFPDVALVVQIGRGPMDCQVGCVFVFVLGRSAALRTLLWGEACRQQPVVKTH